METLVVLSQHRNHQHYNRSEFHYQGLFGSAPSGGFRDISCRFQSSAGILPNPFKSCTTISPSVITKPSFSSPNTQQQEISPRSERNRKLKTCVKSNAISINLKECDKGKSCEDDLCYSELWAGPAYCNSPPPSSLPIPKFSLRRNRSVSVELPELEPEIKLHPLSKSVPSSPKREWSPATPSNSFFSTDYATKDLRRILNLDVADE